MSCDLGNKIPLEFYFSQAYITSITTLFKLGNGFLKSHLPVSQTNSQNAGLVSKNLFPDVPVVCENISKSERRPLAKGRLPGRKVLGAFRTHWAVDCMLRTALCPAEKSHCVCWLCRALSASPAVDCGPRGCGSCPMGRGETLTCHWRLSSV